MRVTCQQLVDRVRVVAHGGEHEGSATVFVQSVHFGPVAQEDPDHVVMAVGGCQMEGSFAILISNVDITFEFNQAL